MMSEEKKDTKDKSPIDFTHPSIGGIKVGHPIPVRTDNENPFKHLGGKCVLTPSDNPLFNAKPAESGEKEDDARESRDSVKSRCRNHLAGGCIRLDG